MTAAHGDADIEAFVLKKGFVIQDAFSADVLVCTGSIEELDITFLKAAVSYEGVTELLVVPYESEQIADGEFPVYLVGVFDEGNFVQIKNRTEFAKWLETLIERCQEGKAYGGIGVNMVGFEVGRSELTGIPYSHLSYSSDPIGTVLGLSYEVVAALDSKLIVDLLVLCPHFSRVEFYLTKDASKPVLTRG